MLHSPAMTDSKNTQYTDLEVKELSGSEVEICASLPADVLDAAYKKALKKLGETAKMDGFRKGHVPEQVLLKEFGEGYVLEQAAQEALSNVYPAILTNENIFAIGQPQIQLKKLALGNPLEFSAKTAVMPELKLPDYGKIATEAFKDSAHSGESVKVTDKDLEDTLMQIRKQKAQIDSFEEQKKEGVEKPELKEVDEKNLPELTDEFVKTLGDFKNVEEFTAKVRENLTEEKKLKDKEKKRVAIVEEIIKQTKIELPTIMIESELQRIQAQFEGEVTQTGTKIEDYLKQISKTIDKLREDWKPEAEKRGKLQLILNEIAKENNIKPDKEDVNKEVQHVLAHYKDADETNVRIYVTTTKTNELVFQHLEKLGLNGK